MAKWLMFTYVFISCASIIGVIILGLERISQISIGKQTIAICLLIGFIFSNIFVARGLEIFWDSGCSASPKPSWLRSIFINLAFFAAVLLLAAVIADDVLFAGLVTMLWLSSFFLVATIDIKLQYANYEE